MSRSTPISAEKRSALPTGDAKQVRALLAWATANGIGLTMVTVGNCTVHVEAAPAAAPKATAAKQPKREPPKTIYAQFGGPAMAAAGVNEPGEDDGDWEPVVQRR